MFKSFSSIPLLPLHAIWGFNVRFSAPNFVPFCRENGSSTLLEGFVHGFLDVITGISINLLEHFIESRFSLFLLLCFFLQSLLNGSPIPATGIRTLDSCSTGGRSRSYCSSCQGSRSIAFQRRPSDSFRLLQFDLNLGGHNLVRTL